MKSWSEAASQLVGSVATYADEQQHVLLRRRADWPAVGFEFKKLTKEHKKKFGTKEGKVVVTAVKRGGLAEKAGVHGDAEAAVGSDGVRLRWSSVVGRARPLCVRKWKRPGRIELPWPCGEILRARR
jgi:predicted metalloprotease with PDZ domain